MRHRFDLRVYYEDTDLAGIVYYANYLKFIERARTEMVRAKGIDQSMLREESGIVFAVRRIEADYFLPARFDDALCVETTVATIKGARVILRQDILRDEDALFSASVTLVAMHESGRPARLPDQLRLALS